jgi:hypothetical protein
MSRNICKTEWASAAWTVLFLLFAYPLSSGPALSLLHAAGIQPQQPTYRLVEGSYAPVFYVHRHSAPPMREAFDAYFSSFR